jgi:UDP-N-acetylglucosamine 4,6-dehydratase
LFIEHPDYKTSASGDTGTPVSDGFEYSSGENPHFLSVAEIASLLDKTK